jgi:hypothetical protein
MGVRIYSIWKRLIADNNYFLISVVALILSISIIQNYRFVKDDTGNIVPFFFLMQEMSSLRLLDYIASNEWLSYQPRSFFLTWWIQIGLIKMFGMRDLFGTLTTSFAIFASFIHAFNSFLIYSICKKLKLGLAFSSLLAFFALVLPTASMGYMISNNWFFLLPLFFTLCFSSLLLGRLATVSTSYSGYSILFLLLLCIMFSGEQLMVIPYFLTVVSLISVYLNKSIQLTKRKIFILQNSALIILGLLSYVIYIKVYARGPAIVLPEGSLTKNIFDIPSLVSVKTFSVLAAYTASTFDFILKFFNINSSLYGGSTINFSLESVGLSCLATVIFVYCIYQSGKQNEQLRKYKFFSALTFFLLLFFSCMLTMYFGAISGNRPGPDDRYLMAPTVILVAFILFCVQLLISNKKILLTLLTPFFFYSSLLTMHLNIDVWSNQRKLDMRLWATINQLASQNVKFILTINNDTYFAHRGLQRPYLSAAWTDFNADWGVTPRIKYELNKDVRLIHNVIINKDGNLTAVGYWGDKLSARNSEIKVVYFNDGPTMEDAIKGSVSVMDWGEYLQSIKFMGTPNRVIE